MKSFFFYDKTVSFSVYLYCCSRKGNKKFNKREKKKKKRLLKLEKFVKK